MKLHLADMVGLSLEHQLEHIMKHFNQRIEELEKQMATIKENVALLQASNATILQVISSLPVGGSTSDPDLDRVTSDIQASVAQLATTVGLPTPTPTVP